MKKSTLITTIAMIVVVVVALSTATYAWFSASEVAVASVNMSTTASSDWALVEGKRPQDSENISFAGASSDQISLENSMNGLYSPIAEITTGVSQALQATDSNRATFYSAKKNGSTVIQDGEAKAIDPYYIRVINTKNTQKTQI